MRLGLCDQVLNPAAQMMSECTASEFNPKAQTRRKKVEMLFANLKRILGLGRLRLRGPCGVLSLPL